ncbi:MAG: hypothetical protein M3367_06600 [Acidobacteriota bacterium]|nr:hypothetical protein [Acidobacteriota bacterium]
MEFYKQIEKEAETILSELRAGGLSLVVTGKTSLRIKGEATPAQLETCRKWKARFINQLSPKCSNCTQPLQLINSGALWFCPFGCESRA